MRTACHPREGGELKDNTLDFHFRGNDGRE